MREKVPMNPWERRLKDLAQLHYQCSATYFKPELFRMNSNQFLQTARTVTFLIQKNKAKIPDFDSWYSETVRAPWKQDAVMTWARDARNQIEKRGDLELNSTVSVSLVFSDNEDEDLQLEISDSELIMVGVKRLTRFARKFLPSGVSDSAVVKVERRWVTSSLKDWELLTALSYVYARMHDLCVSLAGHLGEVLDDGILGPPSLDLVRTDARKTRYLKLRETGMTRAHSQEIKRDPEFVPPDSLVRLVDRFKEQGAVSTLEVAVERHTRIARETFERFGSHISMVFLFDDAWIPIDQIATMPADQSEKYMFWRSMEDRILYMKAHGLIFVCEAWIRDMKRYPQRIARTLPVLGEVLEVIGMDRRGRMVSRDMEIIRDSARHKPRLVTIDDEDSKLKPTVLNFLIPVKRAFAKLSTTEGIDFRSQNVE